MEIYDHQGFNLILGKPLDSDVCSNCKVFIKLYDEAKSERVFVILCRRFNPSSQWGFNPGRATYLNIRDNI